MNKIIFILTIVLGININFAQSNGINNLKSILKKCKTNKDSIDIYSQIALQFSNTNPDSSELYFNLGIKIASKINDTTSLLYIYKQKATENLKFHRTTHASNDLKKYLSYCKNKLDSANIIDKYAMLNTLKGDYNEALKKLDQIRNNYKTANDTQNYINTLINSAIILHRRGIYSKATEQLFEALKLSELTKTKTKRSSIFQNLGEIFARKKDYKKAIFYFKNAFYTAKHNNNPLKTCESSVNLGTVLIEAQQQDSAIKFLNIAKEYSEKYNYEAYKPFIYYNFGQIFFLKNNIKIAIKFYKKSLDERKLFRQNNEITFNYLALSTCYTATSNFKKALKYCDSSLVICNKTKNIEQLIATYKNYYQIYSILGNKDEQIKSLNKLITLKDSANKISEYKQVLNLEYLYQSHKKDDKISKLNYISKIREAKLTRRNYVIYSILTILILLIIIFLITRQKQKILYDRNLIKAEITSKEVVKDKIAGELHEKVGSKLIELLTITQNPEHISKLKNIYSDIRQLSHALSEPIFEEINIQDKISSIINTYSKINKIKITFFNDFLLNWQEIKNAENIQKTLFRAFQELITNAIKHAQCDEIEIQLINDKNHVNFLYNDNGIGFEINQTKKGIGLNNINKRVKLLKGTITIESVKNVGTTIIIKIPYTKLKIYS